MALLEEELLERFVGLRAMLASVKADPDRLRQSVEQFIELTTEMRQKTNQVNESINFLGEKAVDFSCSSRHLGSSYRALADLFRKKARNYSEKNNPRSTRGLCQGLRRHCRFDPRALQIAGRGTKETPFAEMQSEGSEHVLERYRSISDFAPRHWPHGQRA